VCGIAGYLGSKDISPDTVQATLKLMGRRGPDHAGNHRWNIKSSPNNNLVFLHSRLSIIDLDPRANQPFNCGKKWMVFNGELYNYIERRDELLDKSNQELKTTSDTEVFLKTIDHFGWESLDRCEGMWAFAVYDEEDGSLTLCRDRFGEKPLYLYKDETGLYFGSEVKFITSLLGRPLDINYEHMYRYMVYGYKFLYKGQNHFFKGLTSLPPSQTLRIEADGQERSNQYWSPTYHQKMDMTYAEAVEGARERLIESVKLRLRADVPLAFCMSGGVDSNSLISIAKRVFNYDVHGFTITNVDARYEEQDMVDHAVSELGIRHTSIPVNTQDFISKLKTLIRYHDAPVCTITYYAHWLLQESIAAHKYRISISGTAADELFTGYYDHQLMYLAEVSNETNLHATSKKAWEKFVRPIVRNPHLSNPDLFIQSPNFRNHIFLESDGFRQYLLNDWHEEFSEQTFTNNLLRNRMLNEIFHETVPVILHEDDLNAMYFSIENRSPFLDRALFEFCHQIPTRHLIQNGLAKSVLRDAMRGIVPDKIIDCHRKVGFNAPIYSFLDVHDPKVRKFLLNDSPIYNHIKREKIEQLIGKEHLPNSESKFLFYFLNCKIFLEEFEQ